MTPYKGFLEKDDIYTLYSDGDEEDYGFIFECHPAIFASEKVAGDLENVYTFNFPVNTTIQFILHCSNNLSEIKKRFNSNRIVNTPIFDKMKKHKLKMIDSLNLRTTRLFFVIRILTLPP